MTFTEIFYLHKNLVFNLAFQYCKSIEDAEEITQDVFLKVYEKFSDFRNESALKTWIYKITINQSLDFIKAKKTLKRADFFNAQSIDNEELKLEIKSTLHPGNIFEQKEAFNFLMDCIEELPYNQKTIIFLLKMEQKPMSEVAEIMELTYKGAESLIQRAKKNLEKIIQIKKESAK